MAEFLRVFQTVCQNPRDAILLTSVNLGCRQPGSIQSRGALISLKQHWLCARCFVDVLRTRLNRTHNSHMALTRSHNHVPTSWKKKTVGNDPSFLPLVLNTSRKYLEPWRDGILDAQIFSQAEAETRGHKPLACCPPARCRFCCSILNGCHMVVCIVFGGLDYLYFFSWFYLHSWLVEFHFSDGLIPQSSRFRCDFWWVISPG